jgi:F0F1-type ATP synthase assembly protein I
LHIYCLLPQVQMRRSGSYMSDKRYLGRSIRALQENLDRGEPAIFASYGLIGAILLLGGTGYLLDWWLDTSPWFLLAGLLAGVVVGFYGLVRVIWQRSTSGGPQKPGVN